MADRANNIVRVPTSLEGDFFQYWFAFLAPFHHLTPKEALVAASLVKQRFELSKVITDPDILERDSMSEYTKKKVREECKISLPHFQVIMGKLREKGIIKDKRINPKFIPKRLNSDDNSFQLLVHFDFNGNNS